MRTTSHATLSMASYVMVTWWEGAPEVVTAERRQQIVHLVRSSGSVDVSDLSQRFGVSAMTVRRDLEWLAAQGLVQRTRGGAMAPSSRAEEIPYESKAGLLAPEKQRIGQTAARLVREGDTVLLDSGSTTLHVARALKTLGSVAVVTNDLRIACELSEEPRIRVITPPGTVRSGLYSLQGPQTVDFLRNFHVDWTFLGADAIDVETGVTNRTLEEVPVKQAMIEAARGTVLVTDHTKFGQVVFGRVCPLEALNVIVSDRALDRQYRSALQQAGVRLLLA